MEETLRDREWAQGQDSRVRLIAQQTKESGTHEPQMLVPFAVSGQGCEAAGNARCALISRTRTVSGVKGVLDI